MSNSIDGLAELKQFLQEFPERVQRRVCRLAVKKAAVPVRERWRALTPRQQKTDKKRTWHTQDKFTSKAWNRQDNALQIIGVESGYGRLEHLIERGTTDRYHNMQTAQQTVVVGTKVRNRRVKLANGGYRTVKEVVERTKRFGTGSREKAGGRGRYVGRMPAYRAGAQAISETAATAQQIMEQEVRAGLNRVVAKNGASGE